MTEGRATEFPKIYRAMAANGSPEPKFETDKDNSYFLATLPIHQAFRNDNANIASKANNDAVSTNDVTDNASGDVGINVGIKSNMIIDLVSTNPSMSIKQIADNLNTTPRTIERKIKTLRENGILQREGSRKSGHWVVMR